MLGTFLENLSNRNFKISIFVLLVAQLSCFGIGFINLRFPTTWWFLHSIVCVDENPIVDNNRWFTESCDKSVHLQDEKDTEGLDLRNLVIVKEVPDFGRSFPKWQHIYIGLLEIDLVYQTEQKLNPVLDLGFDIRLAYKDKSNYTEKMRWQYYNHAEEKGYMGCTLKNKYSVEKTGYFYTCTTVPLFKLLNTNRNYYLLNIRLLYNETCIQNIESIVVRISPVNDDFAKFWVGFKTFLCLTVVGIMALFCYSIHKANCAPSHLQYMLISLGSTLAFLNIPIEFLGLWSHIPCIGLLSDIHHGVFYTVLHCFWLIFSRNHILIQDDEKRNSWSMYWKDLSLVVIGCFCLSVIYLYEYGIQSDDPFNFIWMLPVRTRLSLWFITLECALCTIYFIFLCCLIRRVFKNINSSNLPKTSQARLLHYNGNIYRFKSIMWVTIACAAVTILSFILSQTAKVEFRWSEMIHLSSLLYMGTYGMWNIYVCSLLIFYTPRLTNSDCTENEDESTNLSVTRMFGIAKKRFGDSPVIKYFVSKMVTCWNTLVKFWQAIAGEKITQSREHSVSQDIGRLMFEDTTKDTLIDYGEGERPITVHSFIIKCRSAKLGNSLLMHEDEKNENIKYKLDLGELSFDVVSELVHYIYTDNVENLQKYSQELLFLSTKVQLPGLTDLCERYLMENLTSTNVPEIILLAEKCGCDKLKKASLIYLFYCGKSKEDECLLTN